MLEQLLVLDLDLLVLLFQFLVLKGHPLVLHVQAHHLRLQLGQPLLQHRRVVRVEVLADSGLTRETGVRKDTQLARRLLREVLVVLEMEVTVRVTSGIVQLLLVLI